ncbi:MAG: DeoR/GlpR family transcriptional regulator, partial [Burkholderiales bacterium]|nr:DeoR/GlpR family transcriptional regulator [Anaerolineae bacterium]
MMTLYERRQTILRLIHERTSVHVTELSRLLDVSEGTIRNDLTAMEDEGLIVRVRGGAAMRNTTPPATVFAARAQVNFDAKRRIAQWAADMIEDGDTIALDASTTVLNIASFLHDRRGLTIITNGIEVARTLAQNPTHTVILLGGVLRADGNAINGTLGQAMLKDLRVKTAFVSCVGLTLENGVTEADVQQAQIKELLIGIAGRVVLLVDSSKFGQVGLVPFAALPQIAHIVTDDEIAPSVIDDLRRHAVNLTVCGEDTVDTFAPHDVKSQPSRIGFANLSEDLLFAVDVRRGLERAVQSAGQINLALADNQMNSDVALSVADHLIARGLDLMIEYQLDENMGSVIMDKFKRANIPVIAVDIPMVGATYFGVDNFR